MLMLNSDKRPGDLFACMEAPSPSDPVPRNSLWTSRFDFHALLLVCGMRRRSLEDRLPLLSRRSAMALRKPLRLQPLQQAPQSRLSWEFQPLSFDQYRALGESTMEFLEKLSPNCHARVLQPWCCTTPSLSGHQLQHVV
jgi:hypothetical protein